MEHKTRESWYLAAATLIGQRVFKPAGYELPKLRIGCGWPTRNRKKIIGQCFPKDSSGDKTYEVFVSPKIIDPVQILAVIIHEFCHAIAGTKAAHKKPFINVMKAVGMVKKWTESNAGEGLTSSLVTIQNKLGPYPHAALALQQREGKKQSTRLLKVQCPKCEYVVRVTRKWLDEAGAPLCPIHKVAFQEEKKDE